MTRSGRILLTALAVPAALAITFAARGQEAINFDSALQPSAGRPSSDSNCGT